MKALVSVSVFAVLGLAAAPSPTAAMARSGDHPLTAKPTTMLVAHACRGDRGHRGWYHPQFGFHAWYDYGFKHWGKQHRRHGGRHGWQAHKRGHDDRKHYNGHGQRHHPRYR